MAPGEWKRGYWSPSQPTLREAHWEGGWLSGVHDASDLPSDIGSYGGAVFFIATVAAVTEGSDVVLNTSGVEQLEYYVEPWSATDSGASRDYTDPQGTSSEAWALVGVNGTVSFP